MGPQASSSRNSNARSAEFIRLLKQHDRRVAACIFSLVPDWSDAEDLFQDTCVRLWEQFDDYRSDEDFGAWACTIARYLVLAYQTRTRRERLQFSPEAMDVIAAQVAADHEMAERRLQTLADCVRQLSDSARNLLDLCYAKGIKIKDVATQLGRSVNGTYLMLSRIRHELHDCVETTLASEERK